MVKPVNLADLIVADCLAPLRRGKTDIEGTVGITVAAYELRHSLGCLEHEALTADGALADYALLGSPVHDFVADIFLVCLKFVEDAVEHIL